MNWPSRLIIFVAGLFCSGLGIAVSTKANLGTTPISSLPYVFTFFTSGSLGDWTIATNALMILSQVFILGRHFPLRSLGQIPTLIVFGKCIDTGMWITDVIGLTASLYPVRLLQIIAGSFILALGIRMQLLANVMYIPGEGLVKAIADRWHLRFGNVKQIFDTSLVLTSIIIILAVKGQVLGIREGTLIAAFCVGGFVKLLSLRKTNLK